MKETVKEVMIKDGASFNSIDDSDIDSYQIHLKCCLLAKDRESLNSGVDSDSVTIT